MMRILAFDEGWRTTTQAEHETLLRVSELGVWAVRACTHFLPANAGLPSRVAVTVQVTEPYVDPVLEPLAPLRTVGGVLDRLLAAHITGRSGRAFVFPGMDALGRIVTVGRLLTASAVDDVVTLGGDVARTSDRIDTKNYLRPEFSAGRLILRTRTSVLGVDLVPIEQPDPTPCCAQHQVGARGPHSRGQR